MLYKDNPLTTTFTISVAKPSTMAASLQTEGRRVKLLVINPNSSIAMTGGLDKMISDLGYHEVRLTSKLKILVCIRQECL